MKNYIQKMKTIAAESSADIQEEAQADVFRLTAELLAQYPERQKVKEMFVILSSLFALAVGNDAAAALIKLKEIMAEPERDIFRVINEHF